MRGPWMLMVMGMLTACSVPQPEIPEPEPHPVPTYRDPADLPGPHSLPPPAPAPDADTWQPVDPATLAPMPVTPCNAGLAPLYRAALTRDMGLASQVHGAALGCVQAGRLDDAQALASALVREDAQPIDWYVMARVTLARRGEGGETVCTNDAYMQAVLDSVLKAADPEVSARMIADPAFEPLHRAYRYRLATMPGDDHVTERLTGSLWYALASGAFGSLGRLELMAEGRAVVHQAQVEESGPVWSESAATWSVSDGTVVVEQDGSSHVYTLDETAAWLQDSPDTGIPAYQDHPSECEA